MVYNVSQDSFSGKDLLFIQQRAQYTNDYHTTSITTPDGQYIDPKLYFITHLRFMLTETRANKQDIILMGDFNDTIGDNINPLTRLIQDMYLRDVHAFTHGYDYDIIT